MPNVSFKAVPNPYWAKMNIPGIPAAKVTVDAKISSNVSANALSVLNNSADIFDWADTIPGSLLPRIKSQASDRFDKVNLGGSVYYIFLNPARSRSTTSWPARRWSPVLNEAAIRRLGLRAPAARRASSCRRPCPAT